MSTRLTRALSQRHLRSAVAVSLLLSQLAPGFALARPAAAPAMPAHPLLDRVPEDALVYAGFAGTDSPMYGTSKLSKVMGSDKISHLLDTLIPDAMASHMDPAAVDKYKTVLGILKTFTARPLAVYIAQPKPGEDSEPDLVAMIDGGDKADALIARILNDIKSTGGDTSSMHFSRDGNLLFLRSRPAEAPAKPERSLAASADFQHAVTTAKRDPFATVYLNAGALLALGRTSLGMGQDRDKALTAFDGTGLSGVRSIYINAGFDAGGNYVTDAAVIVPEPRIGLVSVLIAPRAGPDTLLSRVPADALSCQSIEVDLAAIVDKSIEIAVKTDPSVKDKLPMIWNVATAATGVRVREDFIGALGPDWTYFQPGDAGAGVVVINKAVDAPMALRSIDAMLHAGQRFLLMASGEKPDVPRLMFSFKDAGGTKITTIKLEPSDQAAVPPVFAKLMNASISYAAKDGLLFFSMNQDSLANALTAPAKDITTAPAYQAVMAQLSAPANSSIAFFDLVRSAVATKAMYHEELGTPEARQLLKDIDIIPMLDALFDAATPQLAATAEARWVDADGMHSRSISPFPGAEIVSGGGGASTATIGGTALATSILLPSLNRARETANRVKSASNLRQIGMACMLHANENQGKYPDDNGQMLLTQDISLDVFTSPRTSTAIPADVMSASKQEQAIWATSSSDYIYLGKGLTNAANADVVIAHERLDRGLTDGINILFADGHVEFCRLKDVPGVMDKSKAAGGK